MSARRVAERSLHGCWPPPGGSGLVPGSRGATSRRWEAWFSILDRWGAGARKQGETVGFLNGGARRPGLVGAVDHRLVRTRSRDASQAPAGGRVHDIASMRMAVPIGVLFDAFVNPRSRKKWLVGEAMSLRTSQPCHAGRFDWGDGLTRVSVSFVDKGPPPRRPTSPESR